MATTTTSSDWRMSQEPLSRNGHRHGRRQRARRRGRRGLCRRSAWSQLLRREGMGADVVAARDQALPASRCPAALALTSRSSTRATRWCGAVRTAASRLTTGRDLATRPGRVGAPTSALRVCGGGGGPSLDAPECPIALRDRSFRRLRAPPGALASSVSLQCPSSRRRGGRCVGQQAASADLTGDPLSHRIPDKPPVARPRPCSRSSAPHARLWGDARRLQPDPAAFESAPRPNGRLKLEGEFFAFGNRGCGRHRLDDRRELHWLDDDRAQRPRPPLRPRSPSLSRCGPRSGYTTGIAEGG